MEVCLDFVLETMLDLQMVYSSEALTVLSSDSTMECCCGTLMVWYSAYQKDRQMVSRSVQMKAGKTGSCFVLMSVLMMG